ncbi:MAG: hypothetical protein ACRC62_37760 [Microcoleus sp.]
MSSDFKPELVELTPYFQRQQQATVHEGDLPEFQKEWEKDPPEEGVKLILDAEEET